MSLRRTPFYTTTVVINENLTIRPGYERYGSVEQVDLDRVASERFPMNLLP